MKERIRSNGSYQEQTFEGIDSADVTIGRAEFRDCRFYKCRFPETIFNTCTFDACVFRECDLGLAKLPHCSFSGTVFEGCKLIGINWTEARWAATRLWDPVTFRKCVLDHSTFLGLSLKAISLTDCMAKEVDFREVDLSEADFAGTDLTGSLFSGTNLTGASFDGAYNYSIDPRINTLKGAKFALPEAMSLLAGLEIELTGWGE
ncbi:MAG: pentapeptide repeat-containing protein [Candidatus Eisenbacteria bacterium]